MARCSFSWASVLVILSLWNLVLNYNGSGGEGGENHLLFVPCCNNEWKEFNRMKVMNPCNVSVLPSSKNYFNASFSHHALPPHLKMLQIDYFRMHTNAAVTLAWKPFYWWFHLPVWLEDWSFTDLNIKGRKGSCWIVIMSVCFRSLKVPYVLTSLFC